jgi:flagellar biosynthesis protein FliR
VTGIDSDMVLHTFLLFCRIGGCLMFMPGFSSPRVPMQVRVFLSMAATLALAPIMVPAIKAAVSPLSAIAGLQLILAETTKGALIGLMGRFFFLALEFVSTLAASAAGFSNMPGIPLEAAEPTPEFAAFITMTATTLFFITDQHWEVLRALLASYRAMPVTASYSTQLGLVQMTDVLARAFLLGLQISSPFIIYSIGINILFGIANKLTPQIAVYFVSLPFVVMGGLIVLYFVIAEFLNLFILGFAHWLKTG